jgi:hypothetical protein
MCQVIEKTTVGPSEPLADEVIQLSILDQHALRMWSDFVLVFKTRQNNDVDEVIHHLKHGLARALSEIPDFATTVMPMPGSTRKELELHIGPESEVPFYIVDHRACVVDPDNCHEMLQGTFEELAADNFPLTKIPWEVFFVPRASPEDHCPEGLPSLLVQVNVIQGGLLLGITWHHTVADGRGVSRLLNAWAKGTRMSFDHEDADLPDLPTDEGRERWRLDYSSPGATIDDFAEYVVDPAARSPKSDYPHLLDCKYPVHPDSDVSIWYFRSAAVKSLVSWLNGSGSGNAQLCTPVEALSALLWKHLSLARQLHVLMPEGSSLFTTRIDYRRRLNPPLPHAFIGNANQPVPRTRASIREVCALSTAESLVALTQKIRSAVAENDYEMVRSMVGLVETLPSVTDLALEFNTCPGPDIAITDLSGLDIMLKDWGESLGRIFCMRVFVRHRGFAALLPQDSEGGFPLLVQCEVAAIERLKVDDTFMKYAQFLY